MRRVTAGLVLVGALGLAYLLLPARGSFDVRTSSTVAGTSEIVYATGDRLFISGDEFEIEPAPDSLAVTQGGLYFLADEDLHLWGPDGSTQLAAIGGFQPLRTTADGRYLGLVDRRNGPMNLARERIAQFVVIDTRTGREVVRDGVGNGDRWGTDDTDALYSEQPPAFLGFDDRHAYGQTSRRDLYRWHLTTGDRTDVPEPEFPDVPPPRTPNAPGGELVSFDRSEGRLVVADHPEAGSYPGRISPDGRHLAFVIGADRPATIPLDTSGQPPRGATPTPLRFRGRQFVLTGWLDDHRVVGLRFGGPSRQHPDGLAQVVSCDLGTNACKDESAEVASTEREIPVLAGAGPF